MKLVYKGIYKDESQLPKGVLPENATKFVEPSTPADLNKKVLLLSFPLIFIVGIAVLISFILHGSLNFKFLSSSFTLGIFLAFLTILPHEFLHAICFGKSAEIELFVSPKNLMAFIVSTHPISKPRFIFLSLLPNIIFGWLPLVIWVILPYNELYSSLLFSFSFISISFGLGDYLNAFNAFRQMPKGSMCQLSGFNSYWFIP